MNKSILKRYIQIILICAPGFFALLAEAQTTIPSFLSTNSIAPKPEAKSWVLMENETGWVLTANNEHDRVDPASLTKLMTAYLTFEALESGKINATDKVYISEKAWRAPGSRMFLNVDTSATISELIKGLIIQSGNDAAIALAEQIGGSEDGFANIMNDAADKLGMLNTHYINSSGLPAQDHYTTAYDTALLSRAIIRAYPDLYALFAVREYTYNEITQANRNSLLWRDESYDGLKTGHTKAAGYCLAGSAVRDGTRFIATVMGADSTKNRARGVSALIEYGFSQYETATVFGMSDPAQVVELYKGEASLAEVGSSQPVSVVIPKGQRAAMKISYDLPEKLVAPLSVNDAVGQANISFNGSAVGQVQLYPLEEYGLGPIWVQLFDAVKIKLF